MSLVSTPKEFERWHRQQLVRLEQDHQRRMAEWAYLQSPEYLAKLTQEVLKSTHADIIPPWED